MNINDSDKLRIQHTISHIKESQELRDNCYQDLEELRMVILKLKKKKKYWSYYITIKKSFFGHYINIFRKIKVNDYILKIKKCNNQVFSIEKKIKEYSEIIGDGASNIVIKEKNEKIIRMEAEFEKMQEEMQKLENDISAAAEYSEWPVTNDNRSAIEDILRGFKDYAKLKGYTILLSLDDKISSIKFKFTFIEEKSLINKLPHLEEDFSSYLRNINKGNITFDLPVIIGEEEHKKVINELTASLIMAKEHVKAERVINKTLQQLADAQQMIIEKDSIIQSAENKHDNPTQVNNYFSGDKQYMNRNKISHSAGAVIGNNNITNTNCYTSKELR